MGFHSDKSKIYCGECRKNAPIPASIARHRLCPERFGLLYPTDSYIEGDTDTAAGADIAAAAAAAMQPPVEAASWVPPPAPPPKAAPSYRWGGATKGGAMPPAPPGLQLSTIVESAIEEPKAETHDASTSAPKAETQDASTDAAGDSLQAETKDASTDAPGDSLPKEQSWEAEKNRTRAEGPRGRHGEGPRGRHGAGGASKSWAVHAMSATKH